METSLSTATSLSAATMPTPLNSRAPSPRRFPEFALSTAANWKTPASSNSSPPCSSASTSATTATAASASPDCRRKLTARIFCAQTLEPVLQRKLNQPRGADHRSDGCAAIPNDSAIAVKRLRIGKRRMVEQVEEISPEPQTLPFAQFEALIQRKIHVLLRWTNNAITRRVAVERSVARLAIGERRR